MSSLRLLLAVALLCLVASAVSAGPFIWDDDGVRTADPIPPFTTTDLQITAYTTSPRSVTLCWTLSGDDACVGQSTSYCVRKRLGEEITEANWSTSAIVDGNVPGTTSCITVTGLSGNGFWYFALEASDEAGNVSAVSNNQCIRFSPSPLALCEGGGPQDVTPPATTTDLHITAYTTSPRTVTLYWTLSGDDGTVGQATGYFVKKRLGEEITEANWSTSTDVGEMAPYDNAFVTGLSGDGYWYFALKATDEVCNLSGVSNNDCIKFSPSPLALCGSGKPILAQEQGASVGELAITAVRSNPTSKGGIEVSFTLANGPAATLAVFDAAGRRVEAQDLSRLSPGTNSVRIGASLAAGHYWVRIDEGNRSATRDVTVVH